MLHSDTPDWLSDWRAGSLERAEALFRFDGLAGIEPDEVLGSWQGTGLATGHPFDGLLERLSWHGKLIESVDDVHALVFKDARGRMIRINPAPIPVGLGLRLPRLAKSAAGRWGFAALRPCLRTRRPTARLRKIEFRGIPSAAIVYDRQPIIDHLRRIGDGRLLGLMDMRGAPPFFFLLVREDGSGSPP